MSEQQTPSPEMQAAPRRLSEADLSGTNASPETVAMLNEFAVGEAAALKTDQRVLNSKEMIILPGQELEQMVLSADGKQQLLAVVAAGPDRAFGFWCSNDGVCAMVDASYRPDKEGEQTKPLGGAKGVGELVEFGPGGAALIPDLAGEMNAKITMGKGTLVIANQDNKKGTFVFTGRPKQQLPVAPAADQAVPERPTDHLPVEGSREWARQVEPDREITADQVYNRIAGPFSEALLGIRAKYESEIQAATQQYGEDSLQVWQLRQDYEKEDGRVRTQMKAAIKPHLAARLHLIRDQEKQAQAVGYLRAGKVMPDPTNSNRVINADTRELVNPRAEVPYLGTITNLNQANANNAVEIAAGMLTHTYAREAGRHIRVVRDLQSEAGLHPDVRPSVNGISGLKLHEIEGAPSDFAEVLAQRMVHGLDKPVQGLVSTSER